ncbi:MAG: VOC family protein [Chloroflexi bacterium]|nr:VOC family protein [Chloroflexota bacterium]
MIERLAGVIMWTDQLDAMAAFYRDVLQLPVHSVRPHFVAFECGGARFSVGTHSNVHGPARESVRVTVNFNVRDIHAVHRDLSDRGVAFVRPPEREHWGGWVASLRDPDGNLIQLLEQPRQES